jgi:hypothetical protein
MKDVKLPRTCVFVMALPVGGESTCFSQESCTNWDGCSAL